ncbi:sal-like protein 3 isoform X9 [Neocloeon triangulifer]|uniref:sal-like protein 3 isoform X9 n=1 Tax=Neocloeon triangulifer TaxID=2078957 RepID=UPI00286EE783|nr:sal-like protein 3 isoform X9 [Neocloeon triangulifer]
MSRRKQARPIRVLEPEDALQTGLAEPAEPGTSILGAINENSCSASEDDGAESEDMQDADPNSERSCRRCKVDFTNLAAYMAHKPTCAKLVDDEEPMVSSGEEVEDEKRDGGEVLKRRRLQDAENNNGAPTNPGKEDAEEFDPSKMANVMGLAPLLNLSTSGAAANPAAALASLSSGLPGAAGLFTNSVTLEALQNTKVAVAQFAATALANSANNPAALQELAVLQSTLYTLQHQQMLQMNLIQQLQQQLTLNRDSKEGSPVSPASIPRSQQDDILTPPSPPMSIPSSLPLSSANVPMQTASFHRERERDKDRIMQPSPSSQGTALPATSLHKPMSRAQTISHADTPIIAKPPMKESPRMPSPPTTSAPSCVSNSIIPPHPLHHQTGGVTGCSISASLAASIITNTEPLPSLDEPNSLEMLQRRAQEVLDSASQGLLAGNLADELAFRGSSGSKSGKNGDGKRGNEPFFKHRCRYCGKVFGSDSALQIHIRSHTDESSPLPSPALARSCGSPSESNSLGALDLTPKISNSPPTSVMSSSSAPSSVTPSALFASPPALSLPPHLANGNFASAAASAAALLARLPPMHGPPGGPNVTVRGNTTCNICFKTFACNSALEIHYRSHTKERPFKCTICDRGFSTKDGDATLTNSPRLTHPHSPNPAPCVCDQWRIQHPPDPKSKRPKIPTRVKRKHALGNTARFPYSHLNLFFDAGYATSPLARHHLPGNMKQHMLTHKIRDMPQHLFDTSNKSRDLMHASQMMSHGHRPSLMQQQQQPPPPHPQPPMHLTMPPLQNCSNSNSEDGLEDKAPLTPTSDSHISARSPDLGLKRSPPEDDLPMAKRPSGLHKHLCHVCNKNFSSSSALQIHMRTHTGDKPFKCTVCQKAFTTKGNLKQCLQVHMGTHMWNNGASRRGRRMSLDLPPIPMTPKDSEFLQRRPDLFYPYLPAPFLNGMQQKLNEISVIQSSTPPGGLPSPPNKYGHHLGFPGLGQHFDKPLGLTSGEVSRSPSPEDKSSPLSLVRHAASPPTASAWDMHYRRLSPAERNGGGSPPSTQQGIMSLSPSPPAQNNSEAPQHRGESLVA